MKLNFARFGDCVNKIIARGRMTEGEARQILAETANRAEKMRASGVPDPFVTAAADLAQRLTEVAKMDRADALRNAVIRKTVLANIEAKGGIANAIETIRSLLHGTNRGGRDNIQSQWRGLAELWLSQLSWALHKAGIEKAVISGALDKDIAEALWRAHGGVYDPNVKIPKAAQDAADAIKPLQDIARQRLNDAGARIGDAMDYVAHTDHDPRKMRAAAGPRQSVDAAFAAWWKAERPRWSDKTFEDLEARDGETEEQARTRFARSVFEALVSGIHMTHAGASGINGDYMAPAFEGTHNVARKVSQPRVIHYKDAQSWLDHQRQFGAATSVGAAVMRTLDSSARNTALMEKLGTNPAANLNQIIDRVQQIYRSDLDSVAKFQRGIEGLNNVMGRLDGRLNIPANEMAARIAATTRTVELMGTLGGISLTHFASIWPTVTSELAHHGVPRLSAFGNMILALIRGKGDAERQALMSDLGAYAAGLSRDMFYRWQPDDVIPGKVSAAANTFMKWTGIHYIFDNTQAAVREMLAHQLGRNAGSEFGALDPNLSQMLGKYGIGQREWDLMRSAPNPTVSEGRRYMTPRDAGRIDRGQVETILRGQGRITNKTDPPVREKLIDRYITGVQDKLLSYYSDAADHSVVTPGVKERAMLLGATRPGTPAGELMRFVTQFKMWPVAAMSQVLGREIYTSLSAKDAALNIFTLAAIGASFGYLRMTIKDISTGSPPRNPLDPKTLLASLAQSGGFGILGDFLFGEVNRMGGGLLDVAAGPVIGDADQFIKIFNRFRSDVTDPSVHHKNGEFADLWPDLAHFASRHIPFANLIYLKGTLDYMLWYHLFEVASPGWWERTNRRLEKEQGRSMTGYVPGEGVPTGVPWLYMKNRMGESFGFLGQNK